MWKIATLVWIVLGTTLAGSALTIVVAMPSLASQSMKLIPIFALAGFAAAVPLAVWIAKKIEALTAPRA